MIAALLAVAVAAAQPLPALTVDPKHRVIEGIASDGRTIWLSSLIDRQLLACRTTCRTFATLPPGLHPFAIAWDQSRRRLWVAADCPPNVPFITPCERGALIALDPRGRIRTRIAPAAGPFHPGDVSSAKGGTFVSDSQNGAIYRLSPSGRALTALVEPGVGKSGQGTALDASGKRLIVADYGKGIAAVDLASGTRTLLPRAGDKPLRGIDGLVRCGTTFFGIYNGAAPGTLVAIRPVAGAIEVDQPLGDVTLPDPTQIAFDGKRLLLVADSGWATIGKADFKRTAGASIVAIPLGEDCRPI